MTEPARSLHRWAWAEIDVAAVEHNAARLAGLAAPAQLWAVVKADGYGHGAVRAARAALRGGATGLCVALVDEGLQLRSDGITDPVLVLSEQPPESLRAALRSGLTLTVASRTGVDAVATAAATVGPQHPPHVHLKVDTGMHRVGSAPDDAVSVARHAQASGLHLAGVFTHLAVADDPTDPYTEGQLDQFDRVLDQLRGDGVDPGLVHAANSAGAIAHPRARHAMVRTGIALYGIEPGPGLAGAAGGLDAALSLHARVSVVRRLAAGERISYGLRHRFDRETTVAVLPIGYADGVPRRSFECGIEVLIGGVRRPIVGVVTMDQLMVDVGDDDVHVGDPAVLIGCQGGERITAEEWGDRLGTIGPAS
ncbi:MAG: alanine racemase [Actinobacteria bacterium]|nr:alanine racemase [Actinomycetota bacterium]